VDLSMAMLNNQMVALNKELAEMSFKIPNVS
jgi:hypothetical protein